MLPVSIRIFKMDTLIYILLFIIISILIPSLLMLHYIVKFLHTMQANFLKDIQLGVNYIYSNQSKINYIYKRLKERKKE